MESKPSVRIIFFEQSIGCESCAPARRVLEEIAIDDSGVELEVLNLVLDKEKAAAYVSIACRRSSSPPPGAIASGITARRSATSCRRCSMPSAWLRPERPD